MKPDDGLQLGDGGSVRRRLKAFDARLQIGEAFFKRALGSFECTQAAIQLCMRELDHCLGLGRGALYLFVELGGFAIERFPRLRDALSHELDLMFGRLECDGELAARFDVSRSVLLSYLCVRLMHLPTHLRVRLTHLLTRLRVFLAQPFEQALQFLIVHRLILPRTLIQRSGAPFISDIQASDLDPLVSLLHGPRRRP